MSTPTVVTPGGIVGTPTATDTGTDSPTNTSPAPTSTSDTTITSGTSSTTDTTQPSSTDSSTITSSQIPQFSSPSTNTLLTTSDTSLVSLTPSTTPYTQTSYASVSSWTSIPSIAQTSATPSPNNTCGQGVNTLNGQCNKGYYCDTGTDTCIAAVSTGALCTWNGMCQSGNCSNGICVSASGNPPNTGAIAGGVIGGIVLCFALFLVWRRVKTRKPKKFNPGRGITPSMVIDEASHNRHSQATEHGGNYNAMVDVGSGQNHHQYVSPSDPSSYAFSANDAAFGSESQSRPKQDKRVTFDRYLPPSMTFDMSSDDRSKTPESQDTGFSSEAFDSSDFAMLPEAHTRYNMQRHVNNSTSRMDLLTKALAGARRTLSFRDKDQSKQEAEGPIGGVGDFGNHADPIEIVEIPVKAMEEKQYPDPMAELPKKELLEQALRESAVLPEENYRQSLQSTTSRGSLYLGLDVFGNTNDVHSADDKQYQESKRYKVRSLYSDGGFRDSDIFKPDDAPPLPAPVGTAKQLQTFGKRDSTQTDVSRDSTVLNAPLFKSFEKVSSKLNPIHGLRSRNDSGDFFAKPAKNVPTYPTNAESHEATTSLPSPSEPDQVPRVVVSLANGDEELIDPMRTRRTSHIRPSV